MANPITPHELRLRRARTVPDCIIEAINEMMFRSFREDGWTGSVYGCPTKTYPGGSFSDTQLLALAEELFGLKCDRRMLDDNWPTIMDMYSMNNWELKYQLGEHPGRHGEAYIVFRALHAAPFGEAQEAVQHTD